jgi:hypothetical protein
MNISQYWQQPASEKNKLFKQVIIPLAYCEIATCHKECSLDGATCYWCQMDMCSEHTVKSHHGKKEIVICAYCRQWERDTGRKIEEGP